MPLKRELPATYCRTCGAAGHNARVANSRCSKTLNGERCSGIIVLARNVEDWNQCANCYATGFSRNKLCSSCLGVGFLFVQKVEGTGH